MVQKCIISTLQQACNSLLQSLIWAMNAQAATFLFQPIRSSPGGFIGGQLKVSVHNSPPSQVIDRRSPIYPVNGQGRVLGPLDDDTQWLNGYHFVGVPSTILIEYNLDVSLSNGGKAQEAMPVCRSRRSCILKR